MVHIFDKYFGEQEQPDNMHQRERFVNLIVDMVNVDPIVNHWGLLIGYKWDYGCNVSIPVTVNVDINVDEDSIIYDQTGEEPTSSTEANIDARAYNIVDIKSWRMIGVSGSGFVWQEDEQVTFPSDGTIPITLTPDMSDKNIEVTIQNFRGEALFTKTFENVNTADFTLSLEESKEFKAGTYRMIVKAVNDEIILPVNSYEIIVK